MSDQPEQDSNILNPDPLGHNLPPQDIYFVNPNHYVMKDTKNMLQRYIYIDLLVFEKGKG